MNTNLELNKKAIHFGMSSGDTTRMEYNGEKDADYFHLFSKQKGYDSKLILSSMAKICALEIKQHLDLLKQKSKGPGTYFISISGLSYVQKNWMKLFNSKPNMKSLILSDDEIFSRKDLLQCLACFDAEDTVFFLISDCETKSQKPRSKAIAESFGEENVKTKAAVLSLGLNPRAMKHLNICSGAVDFEYATKTAKTLHDVLNNLNDLNASNMKYVNSDLGCYNMHKYCDLAL